MPDNAQLWPHLIVFVDMNAFFASIEQRDHPDTRAIPSLPPTVLTNLGRCPVSGVVISRTEASRRTG